MSTSTHEQPVQSTHQMDRDLLKSFQTMLGFVPKVGGAVIGVLAIGYFVGWRVAQEHYDAFGAGWVASLLSPSELLQRSYTPLSGLTTGVLFIAISALDGSFTSSQLARVDRYTSGAAIVVLVLKLVGSALFGLGALIALSGLATLLFSFTIGLWTARHAFALRDQGQEIRGHQLRFVYFLWLFAGSQLPSLYGEPFGRLDADPKASRLAVVQVAGEPWRLVLARPDRLVIAKLSTSEPPTLKIIDAKDAEWLQRPK